MSISTETVTDPITDLQNQIDQDPLFANLLGQSITLAAAAAGSDLNPDLYAALNTLYDNVGWPTTTADYLTYLDNFQNTIPSENTDPTYDPWKNTPTQNGYSQEIYDRLCHFYYLVDQPINGATLQSYTSNINNFKFASWLVEYATAWGLFLDTADSLTPETLQSFKDDPAYNLQDYSRDLPNWNSFNTFFYRQLNARRPDHSPMRPVANPSDNYIVCAPADCTYKAIYQIDAKGNVQDLEGNPTRVKLKKTHSIGNITELLGEDASPYAADFFNGTFVHYFLSPFDYHRFHTPVSGIVLYLDAVPGLVYLNVRVRDGQFDAPDGSGDGYEFNQARGILVMDTQNTVVGKVVVAPIGMAQVSSVNMYNNLVDTYVQKGTEFGYFAFGGSDIIMLFSPMPTPSTINFVSSMANAQEPDTYTNPLPFHFKYGEPAVIFSSFLNPSM